jgi:site-specific recombinase XerD
MDEYEIYEEECQKVKNENEKTLEGFKNYLKAKKLSNKTIEKHFDNISFYINEYLLYEDALQPHEGIDNVGDFLGYWFIKKTMWSSVSSIKENIASLKHFYTYLNTIGKIDSKQLLALKEEIKENKEIWFETSKRYDDPDTDFEDIW